MKKILLILALISMIILPIFAVSGTYTSNGYFYMPGYGSYGTDEFDEYNAYMEVADNAIKANKDSFDNFEVSDITDVDLTDIANEKILKYNSTSENWECEDDSGAAGYVDISGTPVQYDIPRFTDANTIEGRSYSELKADLDLEIGTDVQALDVGLTSIAGLTTAANKSIYTTALDTYAVYDLTAFARTILDDADASAVRTTIDALQDVANTIDSDHYTDASIGHEHLAPDVISGMADVTSVDADYMLIWDVTDSALKKVDMGEVRGGYSNLTSFVDQTAWRVFYSNTAGDVTELALGVDGTYLGSNGATSAPTFSTPTGAGDMLKAVYDVDQDGDIDVSSGGTEKTSWTQYCIPYLSGTQAFGEIPIGTAEYALTVAAGATGYDWTLLQTYDAGLLSLAGLTYVSPSFIKVTATDTYAIRTIAETITDLALDSDDLSDVSSIAMLNEAESITGNWVNTTNPWADNEVADDITIDLATLATTITVTDNEATNENNPICFVAGADPDGGSLGIETDGDLHYNPSTGLLTSTGFAGALTGNSTTCTTASAGDAAVDFFGASVDAVTDATTCTDLEGTLLSIATGTLNAAIPEDHINTTMLKDDNAPADEDIFCYELTGTTGHWYSRDEVGIKFSKYDATSAPTVNNDTTEGYVVGSRWIDVTNDDAYNCLDNTDGAAVWSTVGGINFLDLTDTPAAYESGKYAKSTASGIIWDTALGVDTYGTPVDNDFAKFTDLNTIEGRSYLETRNDLSIYTVYPQDYATGAGTSGDPWASDCIDDAYTACPTGGTIYLRAGYYELANFLYIGKQINIIGEGINKTFIVLGYTNNNGIYVEDTDYVTLKGFTLDADAMIDNKIGINIHGSDYTTIEDIEVKNAIKSGIQFFQGNKSTFKNICCHDNGDVGFYNISDVDGDLTDNLYRDIYCYDNDDVGFKSRVGDNDLPTGETRNIYDGIHTWGNTLSNIQISYEKGMVLSNSTALAGDERGITLLGCDDSLVYNCVAATNDEYGIRIQASDNIQLTNVISKNNDMSATGHDGFYLYAATNIIMTACQAYDDRTVTAIDIAFVDGGAGEDTITSTSAQFLEAGFMAGKDITVTGSTSNNDTFTIVSVVAGTINVATASLTAEIAGDTVTILQEKVQTYGLLTASTTDNVELVGCNFEGNLTGNISDGASATMVSHSAVSGVYRVGDGVWTNYVQITEAGAMTFAGTASINIPDDTIVKADFADEDWGDMTVLTNVVTIDADAVTYAKIQNVTATDRVLGRSTAGAGIVEEIACTAAGRAILDDADASAQRTTLGLVIGTDVEVDLSNEAGLYAVLSDVTMFLEDLVDDTTPQAGGNVDMQQYYLLIDDALGSDHDYSGLVDSANVGESVVFGDLLYYDWTAVEWKKAKADAVGTTPAQRIALESKSDGQACLMLVQGYIRDDSAFDFGASRIYLNETTAGTCDDTAPALSGEMIQLVGIGITADKMYFNPSIDVGEI